MTNTIAQVKKQLVISMRELFVLHCVLQHCVIDQVAVKLSLHPSTVSFYRNNLLRKCQLLLWQQASACSGLMRGESDDTKR